MAYPAKAVANFFLETSGYTISPMKLQKLLYFAHGWHLALTGEPLIQEGIEAWPYGPVIPSVYQEFKDFGNEPIQRPALDVDPYEDDFPYEPIISREDSNTINLLQRVWEVYKHFSAVQLSNMTHAEGTPWSELAKAQPFPPRNTPIPNEVVRNHFAKMKV